MFRVEWLQDSHTRSEFISKLISRSASFGCCTSGGFGSAVSRPGKAEMEAADNRRTCTSLDPSLESDLNKLIQEGRPIQAIKLLRSSTELGLRDATAWV